MEKTLVAKLLSRIEMKEYYPSRKPKKEKKQPILFFQSVFYFEVVDPITKVVSIKSVGNTYRKQKE